MPRGRNKNSKKIPKDQKASSLSSEFENIDLNVDPEDYGISSEFESIQPEIISAGVQPPSQQLLNAKNELERKLMFNVSAQAFSAQAGTDSYGFENILGVGIGEKITNGRYTGKKCVSVFVLSKESESEVDPLAMVPKKINGIPTDVVATGEIFAYPHRGRYRPAPGGVSVGHYQITAGSLGCLVRRGNQLFILSNNHVLANSNSAQIGDPILQPGVFDGGNLQTDVIARLTQYVEIKFGDQPNFVDCAIAQTAPPLVTPNNKCIGRLNPTPVNGNLFMVVKKCGRTTQFTRGLITATNVTIRVSYGTLGQALYQNQLLITSIPGFPFSQPGDSGSLIVNNFTNQPVGLLFAGSSFVTIANPINAVLSALNVSIYTG